MRKPARFYWMVWASSVEAYWVFCGRSR